jgi:hypothetical protein
MVDESSNWSQWSRPKKSVYIFLNRPQSWPKLELCEHLAAVKGLELWGRLKSSKKNNPDLVVSGLHSRHVKIRFYSHVVYIDSWPGHQVLGNQCRWPFFVGSDLTEFLKEIFWSNFGWTKKNWSFAQKTLPFSEIKSQKSGNSSGFLIFLNLG